jgi:hypothetical protein
MILRFGRLDVELNVIVVMLIIMCLIEFEDLIVVIVVEVVAVVIVDVIVVVGRRGMFRVMVRIAVAGFRRVWPAVGLRTGGKTPLDL